MDVGHLLYTLLLDGHLHLAPMGDIPGKVRLSVSPMALAAIQVITSLYSARFSMLALVLVSGPSNSATNIHLATLMVVICRLFNRYGFLQMYGSRLMTPHFSTDPIKTTTSSIFAALTAVFKIGEVFTTPLCLRCVLEAGSSSSSSV